MRHLTRALLGLVPAVLAAGCAAVGYYDPPYALVESGFGSPVRKELPVLIKAVDGETTIYARAPGPMKPGRHVVDVYLGTMVGPYSKQLRQLAIDANACTRYRIVAGYQNLTHIEWTPVIYREPIGECLAELRRRG